MADMIELTDKRDEYSKTFADGNKRYLKIGGMAGHYKDNYADDKEQWKEIDLTIVDNKITKAPYILEINGDKFTFTDEDGVDHTVRLMDTKNPLQQTKNGSFYGGTITLREEI